MNLNDLLQALDKADAAGDTVAAKELASMVTRFSQPSSTEPQITPDYTYGEMLSKGITRGAKQVGSTIMDVIPAMAASSLGFTDYAKKQMGEAAETQQEIEAKYAPQYKGLADIKGISDYPGFALETIAEQVPNIATSLVPGVGAGALAARAGAGIAGKAAAINAGTFLGSYSQNAPEVFQNIYEKTGKLEPGVAALWGAGSAALDSVLPAKLLNKMTGPMKASIVEKVLERSGMDKGLLRSVSAGVLEGAGWEGLTEGAQEAISISAENFVDKNPQIFGSKEWERIMESSVRGAVGGGAFGAVGGGAEAGRAGAQRREQYAQSLEKRGERQAAQEVRRQGAEIEAAQAQEGQGTLPGFEMGPATSFLPPTEVTEPTLRTPKGVQQDMFTAEGEIAPAVEKATQAQVNRERLEQQREATKLKEDQKTLKDAINDLTKTPKDLVGLAKTPPPLQQTIMQAQGEMDALVAKRGPQAVPAVTPAAAEVAEPTIRKAPEPATIDTLPTTIGTDKDSLKAFGKVFGIGPTAKILDAVKGPLVGKDISDPVQAAQVKTVLEAYASGKPAEGAAAKIETYLKRPEFQGAENVAESVAGPSVASPDVVSQPGAVAAPGAVERVEPTGVVPTEQDVGVAPAGEVVQPTTLTQEGEARGPETPQALEAEAQRQEPAAAVPAVEEELSRKDEIDLQKKEAATEAAVEEQRVSVEDIDARVDRLLNVQMRQTAESMGVPAREIPTQSFKGTEAHNALRLPSMFNEFFRLQDVVSTQEEAATDVVAAAERSKNLQEMQILKDAINASGINANDAIKFLQNKSPEQREAFISDINKQGQEIFRDYAKQVAATAAAKKQAASSGAGKGLSLVDSLILEEAKYRMEEDLSKKSKGVNSVWEFTLYAPVFKGTDFNEATSDLAAKGNVAGVMRSVISSASTPEIKQVLQRIQALGLKTKLVMADVGEGRAGSYDPVTNTITLDPTHGMNEHTFMHEITHAAISHVLNDSSHPLTKQFQKFFGQMQDRLGAAYGAQNLQEFASEVVSNPEFQALLKTIKAPRSESMFKRIMQSIAEIFGFREGRTAYTEGLNFVNNAIDISKNVAATPAQKMFLGNGDFKSVADVGKAMPKLAGSAIEQAKNTFSNIKDSSFAEKAFGLLRLDNLNTLYGKQLPSIQKVIDALELRSGMQDKMIKTATDNYTKFTKIAKKFPEAMKRVNDLAIDARLAGVDVLDPNFKPEAKDAAKHQQLKSIFNNSLPKEVQSVYRTIRTEYENALAMHEAILNSAAEGLSPSLAKQLALEFQARKRVTSYVPFLRNGEFWIEYADPATGERTASAFESVRERQLFADKMLTPNKIPFNVYKNISDMRFTGEGVLPTSVLGKIISGLREQGASPAQVDSVYQAYLERFPSESIVKQFMKSKNVLGMERDIVRGYSDISVRWARRLANSKFSPAIDKAVTEIANQAQEVNDPTVTAAAQNIIEQSAFFHNPTYNEFVNKAAALSYYEYIAGNISSAVINLTSLPLSVWPMLGGKFGFDKATGAMLAAGKVAIKDWSTNPQYKNLYQTLNDHGLLEHTMSRELVEGKNQKTDEYTNLKAKILNGLSIPFAATEKYNRATTAIAAYDLARKTMSEKDAIRYSLNTVKDAHTSGMAVTGSKWMQHPIGRVFFTFKSFAWNNAFIMARAFHQAFKGESPEIRNAARRQLLATYGMASVFAGAKGLPFYGAASTLATMLHAMFGGDDEPYDFDDDMRQAMGELAYKGIFNKLTNLEVANRTGLTTDLIYRDDPRGVAEHGYVLSAMQQAFGPAGSYIVGVGNSVNAFKEGHVERAVEGILPSFARNGLKGARYLVDGAQTMKGDPVIEDVSAYNSLMQGFGFAPADLSTTYEKVSAAKGYEREINNRHKLLLNRYEMARTSGDTDMTSDVRAEISAFNEVVPTGKRITGDVLSKSIESRRQAERDLIHGVKFDKKLKHVITEKFFDDE